MLNFLKAHTAREARATSIHVPRITGFAVADLRVREDSFIHSLNLYERVIRTFLRAIQKELVV